MQHKKILKRSWQILWSYRVLWIFGLLLALTTASSQAQSNFSWRGSGNNSPSVSSNSDMDFESTMEDFLSEMEDEYNDFSDEYLAGNWRGKLITAIVILVVIGLIWTVISLIVSNVSRVAQIQLVNDLEESEQKYSFREGWRLGWSKRAWKLFLVDLTIFAPLFLVSVVYFGGVFGLLLSSGALSGHEPDNFFALIAAIGMAFLYIFITIIVTTIIGLLKHFMRRTVVLEGEGVFDAIRQGSGLVSANLKDVGILWLITVGINIGFPIAFFFALIPVLLFGGGIAALIGVISYGLSSGGIFWTIGFAAPVFLLLVILPMAFVAGLKETYMMSLWTLAYREVKGLNGGALPAVADAEAVAE